MKSIAAHRESFKNNNKGKIMFLSKSLPGLSIVLLCSVYFSPILATEPIGVMPFDSSEKAAGTRVAAQILVNLAKTRRFTLVERMQLNKAISEIAHSQSGNIKPADALKIGKISGAKYLVIGDIQPDKEQPGQTTKNYHANVRIIKTQTGIVIGADNARGSLEYIEKALSIRVNQLLSIYLTMDNSDSPYTILLKLTKGKNPVYKTGETLTLNFKVKKLNSRASNIVYIQIFSIDTRGSMTMIYPNKFANGMQIQIGKQYSFPAQTDDFEWELVPPVGTESIQAIVTNKPVFFFEESKNFESVLFPSIVKKESENTYRAIRIRLKKEKLKDWSAERITYKLLKDK